MNLSKTIGVSTLVLVLTSLMFLHLSWGGEFHNIFTLFLDREHEPILWDLVWNIRAPRLFLGLLMGASLAIAGVASQGLFRNPLADPGVIGISSGALLAVVIGIKLGSETWFPESSFGLYILSFFAFVGSFLATFFVYKFSKPKLDADVSSTLLIGVAVTFFANALASLIIYFSDDNEMRSAVFWSMGSLSNVEWVDVFIMSPFFIISLLIFLKVSRSLDLFTMGERVARESGVDTDRVKGLIIFGAALAVGASVSLSGVIGFVGLVVPHMARLVLGPKHSTLLISSVLLGAIFLSFSDFIARHASYPVELPIGVITAILGTPFFFYLIKRHQRGY